MFVLTPRVSCHPMTSFEREREAAHRRLRSARKWQRRRAMLLLRRKLLGWSDRPSRARAFPAPLPVKTRWSRVRV